MNATIKLMNYGTTECTSVRCGVCGVTFTDADDRVCGLCRMKQPKRAPAPRSILLVTAAHEDASRCSRAVGACRAAFPFDGVVEAARVSRNAAGGDAASLVAVSAVVVVLESERGFIGRGAYNLLVQALAAGRAVYVLRAGGNLAGRGRLVAVSGVRVASLTDWTAYARLDIAAGLARIVDAPAHRPSAAAVISALPARRCRITVILPDGTKYVPATAATSIAA